MAWGGREALKRLTLPGERYPPTSQKSRCRGTSELTDQDSGVAECDSDSCVPDARVCSGGRLGNEGAPKKFLVNNSRAKFRKPYISTATKHKINASEIRWPMASPRAVMPDAIGPRDNGLNRPRPRRGAVEGKPRACCRQPHDTANEASGLQ